MNRFTGFLLHRNIATQQTAANAPESAPFHAAAPPAATIRFDHSLPSESPVVTQPAATSLSDFSPLPLQRRFGTGWLELALAVGGLGVCSGESASMGILPKVAAGLQVSEPQAGHMISA